MSRMETNKHRSWANSLTLVKRGATRLRQVELSTKPWMNQNRLAIVWIAIGLVIGSVSAGIGLAALVASKVSRPYAASLPQALAALDRGHTSPAALAAGLEEAEILQQLGQTQPALVCYRRLIDQAGRAETYSNPWVSLAQLRHRITAAYDRFIAANQFSAALELAEGVTPLFGRAKALQAQAQARRAWAAHLLKVADSLAPHEAQAARDRAYQQLRRAGEEHARLAQLRYAQPELADDLWNSATHYLDGHGFRRAASLFQRYLETELRRRRPDALVGLARALLALNRVDQAILTLEECFQSYPKDPIAYEARRLASLAYAERGDLAQANKLLSQNVYHQSLTPQSAEWRDSLFALGRILYRQAIVLEAEGGLADVDRQEPNHAGQSSRELEPSLSRFKESSRVLSEAIERYPDAPQSMEARYLLAQSHRRSARLYEWKLSLTKIEPVRVTLREQEHRQLAQALETYHKLHDQLTRKQAEAPLTTLEFAILRNCDFGRGDALSRLGRYEEAIRVYSAAASRYQRQPESLEAFVQIADCYRQLGRAAEAQGTIEQAKVVLGRLPENSNFTDRTRWTRQEWDQTLEWLSTL